LAEAVPAADHIFMIARRRRRFFGAFGAGADFR
jgi:hypothetical protein